MKITTAALTGLFFVATITSCGGEQNTKAKIFERKYLPENKLQLKYQYIVGGVAYIDSVTIENKVLATDSLILQIDPNDPSKSSIEQVK